MPETKIIDGKSLAEKIRLEVRKEILENRLEPSLAIILVGDDPASHLYVKLKEKACKEVGINFYKYYCEADISEAEILKTIDFLNKDDDVDAILVQLPLPPKFNEDLVIRAIDPNKDVDGFHPKNLEKLEAGAPCLVPGVSLGILRLIEQTGQKLEGKNAVIMANSQVFARPLIKLFKDRGMTAQFLSPNTPLLDEKTKAADVLVAAIGKPGFVTGEMIKGGAIIIDVGTTKVDNQLIGDVDVLSITGKASFVTPVPGGVGPMTISMLLKNVVNLSLFMKKF